MATKTSKTAKVDNKTAVKPEIKTETKVAAKPEVKADTKTASKTEVKADTKKAETKTTASKKATAKTEAKKETKTADKTATKKAETKVFVQFFGKEVDIETITEAAKADYIAKTGKKTAKNVKIYVKPEDNAAYYVIEGIEGVVYL